MVTETRYILKTQQTINTVTGYELETAGLGSPPSGSYYTLRYSAEGDWGIRVYKVSSLGVKTELTSGVSATIHKDGTGSAELSNTWALNPAVSLAITDAIEVDWYLLDDDLGWQFVRSITEQVQNWAEPDPNQLDAATWTIYYNVNVSWSAYDGMYRQYLYWGTATLDTRITDFTYSTVGGGGLSVPVAFHHLKSMNDAHVTD